MSTFTANWRQRRRAIRNQRKIAHAINNAQSPAMRDELIVIAHRGEQIFR